MPARKVRAVATFVTWGEDDEGRPVEVVVREGNTLPADHPIVEGHREFFEGGTVERATAAPGEPRRTPKRKTGG